MVDVTSAAPWTSVSGGYAEWGQALLKPYSLDALRLSGVKPGDRALDVACGPGTLTFPLSKRVGAEGQVVGVDFSPGMIDALRRALKARGVANVEARVGDGQRLEVEEGVFDAAFSMFGLMFFPDRAAGFGGLYRSLAPGGRALVSCWIPPEESEAMRWMRRGVGAMLDSSPTPAPDASPGLNSAEGLREEMKAAGFEGVEVHRLEHHLEVTSVEEAWRGIASGCIWLTALKGQLGAEAWGARSAAAIEALTAATPSLPLSLSMPALLGVARKGA